ncbi:MAG: helix-turn-helix transcriptional regulator [Verrucomicrobiota bacterium]
MLSDKSRNYICSQVADILRSERLKQNLSMTKMAERAGLSQQMVSYVERELRNPSLDTLLRMTGALGINLADVIRQANKAK